MSKELSVVLLRSGNRLVVEPSTPEIKDLLTPKLSYVEKRFLHGKEFSYRKKMRLPTFEEIEWSCYSEDHKGRLATSYGFLERITAVLEAAGYGVTTRWASKLEEEKQLERAVKVYTPHWERIENMILESRTDPEDSKSGFEFRYKQKAALKLIAKHENGRIDCPPGWGKGTVIMLTCLLFPKAKIEVVTKRIPVLKQRLFPELASYLPSVGMVGGGVRSKGHRVMCYSADSLHHARPDADIVLVDEGQEACADNFASKMGIYEHARIWMFSGSWDMRLDNKDMRAEAMAGPIRLKVTYKQAEEHDMVVPICIVWTDVIMDVNPCANFDGVDKKKYGVWTNEYRNKLIAKDANHYDADTQVLITVETLEHALHLKELLPDFEVVYSGHGLKDRDIAWFTKNFPTTFKLMTEERKRKLTSRFEKGKLKKVIATTVWNVGVNFTNLEVLIRADAGGSPINDTQIPGRNSRTNASIVKDASETKKKIVAIVHDYRDQFDTGFSYKAKGRERSYKRNEWEQFFPKAEKKSMLRRLMNFGSLE